MMKKRIKLRSIVSKIKDKILTEGVLSDWGDNNTPAALKKEKEIKNKKVKPEDAITDLDLNTLNRNQTVKEYRYGPLNPDDEKGSAKFWEDKAHMWDTTVEAAKASRCSNCGAFDQKKTTSSYSFWSVSKSGCAWPISRPFGNRCTSRSG